MRAVKRLAATGVVWSCAALMLGGSTCREEPGPPDYSNHVGLPLDGGPKPEFLPGTDPFIPGTRRLSLGLFYEGDVTQRYQLDPERLCLREPHAQPLRCYFIFEIAETSELHYDQDTTDDRIEGTLSDRFTLRGTAFWGGGVIWDAPTDISAWSMLAVALKSSDPSFARIAITMQSGADEVTSAAVEATDYGYVNDGEWHALRIPLADFAEIDLVTVRAPFVLGGMGNTTGDQLLVDEVYMTQD